MAESAAADAGKTGAGAGPWHILSVALVAQIGISIVEQGIPSLTGFIKAASVFRCRAVEGWLHPTYGGAASRKNSAVVDSSPSAT
jgi:hypothetical protein